MFSRASRRKARPYAFQTGKLQFHRRLKPLAEPPAFNRLLNATKKKRWNVYAKRPFGGPAQVLEYLGCYTHRVTISNHRITDIQNGEVTFTARDRKKNKTYPVKLEATEFIRRFTLHILPPNFMKIRSFGFLANTKKKHALKIIRAALEMPLPESSDDKPKESSADRIKRLTGLDIACCPKCQGEFIITELPKTARAPPGTV